jgi:hypothetical protein
MGRRTTFPCASARRNCSVPRTISLTVRICSLCSLNQQLRVADGLDEEDVPDLKSYVGGLLRWDGHLLRSDMLLHGQQLLKAGIIADRVPDWIDF